MRFAGHRSFLPWPPSPTLFMHSQLRFLDNIDLTRIIESGAYSDLVSFERNFIEGAAERIIPIAIAEKYILVNDLPISIVDLSHSPHSREKRTRHKPLLINIHGQRAVRTDSRCAQARYVIKHTRYVMEKRNKPH